LKSVAPGPCDPGVLQWKVCLFNPVLDPPLRASGTRAVRRSALLLRGKTAAADPAIGRQYADNSPFTDRGRPMKGSREMPVKPEL